MRKQEKRYGPAKEFSKETIFTLRLLLCFLFMLLLASFLHFREAKVEILEVDKIAKGYVVAQVDFQFPDPDATMILKQEALRDVGRIYKISETQINNVKHKFENYLIQHPNWRKNTQATFEEVYNRLDAVVEVLLAVNITDERTYKKREETHLSIENYYILDIPPANDFITLPESFWKQLQSHVAEKYHFDESSTNFIFDYFRPVSWKIYNDIDAQRIFKDVIQQNVPEKYTHVKSGSRIIDFGEKVTPRHIAMLNAMKKELKESKNLWTIQTILGSLLFSSIMVALGAIYFSIRQKQLYQTLNQLMLYLTILSLGLIVAKVAEWLILVPGTQWIEYIHYPIFIPFVAILLCLLLNEEIALFSIFFLTIIMGLALAFEHTYFLFMNMTTGIGALIAARNLKKRKEMFIISAKIWLVAAVVLVSYNLINNTLFSSLLILDLAFSALNLLIISILLIVLLPVLESLFNIMTDMTLMEYMNPTNELLKRLSIEAPGTYQHSLSIGHISEFVANSIGANGLFCRVTTLYHDIGKLNTPHYYTENQMLSGGRPFNIHLLLTPVESAYIIKSHVHDGVALARQHKLPQPFIDIIQQHHGTTLIKYFYAKQLEMVGGNPDDIDERTFRYPGPKPQTKEAAIIMLTDSAEAASRSLEDNSEQAIRKLVDKITQDKVNDGQFDECSLTFKELFLIKTKLVEMIKATHHMRIKYPEAQPRPDSK